MTRSDLALAVLTSAEARQDLIRDLYAEFLHPPAGAVGLQGFVDALANGAVDEDVIALPVGSDEYFIDLPASFAAATIAWGDGSSSAVSIGGGSVVGSHTYGEEGSFPLVVVVHDLDGVVTINGTATVGEGPTR